MLFHRRGLFARRLTLQYEKSTYVSTVLPSFSIGSSSFLQVTRSTIKTWESSNFDQIELMTVELAALDRLEKFL